MQIDGDAETALDEAYSTQAGAQSKADACMADPFDIAGSDDRAVDYLEKLMKGTADRLR